MSPFPPKYPHSDMGHAPRERGQYEQPAEYPELAGFSSSQRYPDADRSIRLERGNDLVRDNDWIE